MPVGSGLADTGETVKLNGVSALPLPVSVTSGAYACPAVIDNAPGGSDGNGGAMCKAVACDANVVLMLYTVAALSVTVNVIGAGLFGVNAVTGPPLNIPAVATPITAVAVSVMFVPIATFGNVGEELNV